MTSVVADNRRINLAAEADAEREQLRAAFVELPAAKRDAPTQQWLERVDQTVDRFIELIDEGRTANLLDDRELAEARGYLLKAMQARRAVAPFSEQMSDFMLAMEAVRHILRDAGDEQRAGNDTPAALLLHELDELLPTVPAPDLADLLGISARQLQRWHREPPERPSDRLLLVHRLVSILVRSWTPAGVRAWFDRPRMDLDGHAPREFLDSPQHQATLLNLARSGRRSQGA